MTSMSDVRELAKRAARLEAAARELPMGPGRDDLLQDVAKFRAQLAALKARRFTAAR